MSEETKEKNRLRARLWAKNNPEKEKEKHKKKREQKKQYINDLEQKIKELENANRN